MPGFVALYVIGVILSVPETHDPLPVESPVAKARCRARVESDTIRGEPPCVGRISIYVYIEVQVLAHTEDAQQRAGEGLDGSWGDSVMTFGSRSFH